MPRKEACITEGVAHLAVDLACYFLLAGVFTRTAGTTVLIGAGYLIFLILSYGCRPFLAMILDEIPRLHSQAVGCLLVAAACLLPTKWAWFTLFPAALGSALFHTGALGESVAFARGYFTRISGVIAPGVFGAALGTVLSRQTNLKGWMLAILLTGMALACFLFAEARKYPRRIRSFRHSVTGLFPDAAKLGLTLIPLLAIALTVAFLPPAWAKGWLLLIPAACAMTGRALGGFLADRFGPRKTVAAAFGAAAVLLTVFTHIPWLYCIGLTALWVPSAVCLGTATAALPEQPHMGTAVCSLALLVGALPGFYPLTQSQALRTVCAGIILLAAAVSIALYTDHCRLFDLRARLRLHRGDKK